MRDEIMLIEIKSRWNGSVIFRIEAESLKLAIEAAVQSGSNLRDSNLRGSNLRDSDLMGSNLGGSDLRGSDLSGSNLRGSDLRGSDLSGSNLGGSNLRYSDLRGSDLRYSDLMGSNLRYSDLRGSDLSGSNLRDSDLMGSNLGGANLTPIRDDIWAVLSSSPGEVRGLRDAIIAGSIDGSTYQGKCCCLVGTLARVRQCHYDKIPSLSPDSSRPAEQFFAAIRAGDTPMTSQFSQLALEWVDLWLANMEAAFAVKS